MVSPNTYSQYYKIISEVMSYYSRNLIDGIVTVIYYFALVGRRLVTNPSVFMVNQDIVRFDISMHDASAVTIV